METHGRYNEKLIEYENTPLWKHPVSISLVLVILSAVFYVHIITTKTHSSNALTTLSKQASIHFNSRKKSELTHEKSLKLKQTEIATQQTAENTSIKQVNPNDIAVVRVESNNPIDLKAKQKTSLTKQEVLVKDSAKKKDLSTDNIDTERLVIAQKVEELEKALQNQVLENQFEWQQTGFNKVSDTQPEIEHEIIPIESVDYMPDYDVDYDYEGTEIVSDQPSLSQEQIDQLANELIVEGIEN